MNNAVVKLLILVVASFVLSGCIESTKRAFDPEYDKQMSYLEIDRMFPEIPNLSRWMLEDFSTKTVEITNTVHAADKMGYTMGRVETHPSRGSILISTQLDALTVRSKGFRSYANFAKAQDELFLEFCKANGISVTRYKNEFSMKLFNRFGVAALTGCTRAINVQYKYTYIGYKDDSAVIAYTILPYEFRSGSISGLYMDTIFLSGENAQGLLDSLSNSFIEDAVSKTFDFSTPGN